MTDRPNDIPASRVPPESSLGLRLRLWLATMSGGLVAGLGLLWVLGTRWVPGADPFDLFGWLTAVAVIATLTGFGAALWLDHHLVGQLRGLMLSLASGRVSELRGLPASSGWGELSDLTDLLQGLLARHRHAARAVTELDQTRRHLESVQEALERWLVSERWKEPLLEPGAVSAMMGVLGRGLSRREQVDEQHRDIAGQLAREVATALADAQETAEQAERGFVEATAMLTTVRELQRLTLELTNGLQAVGAPDALVPESEREVTRWRDATRGALEELVRGSQASVESIATSLLRVQEVATQAQRLGNRATLIAIHAMTPRPLDVRGTEIAADDLHRLATEVREIMERTTRLADEVDADVRRASDSMREVRARAVQRLEAVPSPGAPHALPAGRRWEDAQHLLERVREMVQDAARKGERLSAAGERSSRAAERLARRLEEDVHEADALAMRLAPVGREHDDTEPGAERSPGLRVLDAEPGAHDESGDAEGGETDASERPRERP